MADSQPIFVQSTNPRGLGQRTPILSNVYAIPTDTKSHSTDISTDKKTRKIHKLKNKKIFRLTRTQNLCSTCKLGYSLQIAELFHEHMRVMREVLDHVPPCRKNEHQSFASADELTTQRMISWIGSFVTFIVAN